MKWLEGLNDEQRGAVLAPEESLIIIAGPGTGKTKTLTARIAHLLSSGILPDQILGLTFTNKSAREMRERVSSFLSAGAKPPEITTFHAFCFRLLTDLTGEKPAMISEPERQQIIRDMPKPQRLKGLSTRELGLRLSLQKSLSNAQSPENDFANLLQEYQRALTERGLYDFDDLLLRCYQYLKEQPNKRPEYRHILIDEFQDTNELQYRLLRILSKKAHVFVIGDPLQSIYGFRGARAEIFDQFRKDWPNTRSITLTTNYRSTPEVVALGQSIFPDIVQLRPHRRDHGRVQCIEVLNEYSEAHWIIESIERHIGGSTMLRSHQHHTDTKHGSFGEFAVIYRTRHVAKVLSRLLGESGLPYQVAGEGSPYQKPVIQAIIAALWFVAGKEVSQTLLDLNKAQIEAILDPLHADSANKPVSQLVERVTRILGLDTDKNQQALQSFLNTAVRFDDVGLERFLAHLQDISEQDYYDPSADAIALLTIHAAKGLEFKHVFLMGAEEGILPHKKPKQQTNFDEERRLFYVAITRAQDTIDILYARKRTGKSATLSRFVLDIPEKILPRVTDPDMAEQQRRLKKRAIKRSQTSLF